MPFIQWQPVCVHHIEMGLASLFIPARGTPFFPPLAVTKRGEMQVGIFLLSLSAADNVLALKAGLIRMNPLFLRRAWAFLQYPWFLWEYSGIEEFTAGLHACTRDCRGTGLQPGDRHVLLTWMSQLSAFSLLQAVRDSALGAQRCWVWLCFFGSSPV